MASEGRLHLEATHTTPEVRLDPEAGTVVLRGESYPENALAFYEPVLAAAADFLSARSGQGVTVEFELKYFNSSSTKELFRLFDMLEDAAREGATVTIHWRYDAEDDNLQEFGEDFQEDFPALTFEMIPT